jgi:predicted nucleic acid-binding protein
LGLETLRRFLRRHRTIALDTSLLIYQLEANATYLPLSELVFAWLERPDSKAVTSTITITELLVPAYRIADHSRAQELYAHLSSYPNLDWIAPDLEIADTAAKLRAAHRMRTPDALQAATAIHSQATGLVTNDPIFERIDLFETFRMDRGL